jgi:hypothetical protein
MTTSDDNTRWQHPREQIPRLQHSVILGDVFWVLYSGVLSSGVCHLGCCHQGWCHLGVVIWGVIIGGVVRWGVVICGVVICGIVIWGFVLWGVVIWSVVILSWHLKWHGPHFIYLLKTLRDFDSTLMFRAKIYLSLRYLHKPEQITNVTLAAFNPAAITTRSYELYWESQIGGIPSTKESPRDKPIS